MLTVKGDRSIVITGMGLACALGLSVDDAWSAVKQGRSGSRPFSQIESELPAARDGFEAVPLTDDFEMTLPREARYLRWSIVAALADAGIDRASAIAPARRAVVLGTTLHGMRAAGRFLRSENLSELQSFLAGDTLRLATRGLRLHGGATTTCSACSSSLGSIALGVTLLESGEADLVVAGGYDAVSEYVWGGFNALRLVADGPLRPFARERQGMKLGEGYAIVILERAGDAKSRGAAIHAHIAGWGESADAHHLTQPHPNGEGALRAMRGAIRSAGIDAGDLDMLAAHATGTPDNDAAEFAAISQALGDRVQDVPVVCFKTHIGHTLGAAGAAELILSVCTLNDQIVPPCANIRPEEIEFDRLQIPTGQGRLKQIRHALNTSLGFGGANTSVVITRNASGRHFKPREVCITGIGVLLPGAIGNEGFVQRLRARTERSADLCDADIEHLPNARRVRRMSPYVKIMLAAATLAVQHAGLDARSDLLADCGAMLGTMHGSAGFSFDYYSQIVREGILAANPMLFAEGVPNVAAAHLSMMLGLKRACQTIIGMRTAGLEALRLAYLRIATGVIDRMIVGGAEERHAIIDRAYDHCGLRSARSSGGVALVLESVESATFRGARPLATVERARSLSGDPEQLPRTLLELLKTSAPAVIGSSNATWIDEVERAAMSRVEHVSSIMNHFDRFGETFSATPLVGIAAALLMREPTFSHFTSLCTDWSGCATAATLRLPTN